MRISSTAATIGILLLFLQACTVSKKRNEALYSGFGSLGHNYINVDRDIQVPFVANHQFFESPGRKDFDKLNLPSSLIRLLALPKQEVLFASVNNVLPVRLRVTGYVSGNFDEFKSGLQEAIKNTAEVSSFKEVALTDLPPNIDSLKHAVYDYSTNQHHVVDLLVCRGAASFRFSYVVPGDQGLFADSSLARKLLEGHLKDEVSKIDLFYSANLAKRFQSPLMASITGFRESNANYLYTIHSIDRNGATILDKSSFVQRSYAHAHKLFYSFLGEYEPLQFNGKPIHVKKYSFSEKRDQFVDLSAVSTISKIADTSRVIILNESHSDPRCREMASDLLDSLAGKGYKYLFVEALGDTLLNQRKYPLQQSGVYTSEPMFSNFLRKAVRLGFDVRTYESTGVAGETPEQRDREQAANIHAVISMDPKAKSLVYAGHGHIYKQPGRMAYFLRELSGIDPYCINQAVNDEDPESLHLYSSTIKQPALFYSKIDKEFLVAEGERGRIDAVIVFPPVPARSDKLVKSVKIGDKHYRRTFNGKRFDKKNFQVKYKAEAQSAKLGEVVPVVNMLMKKRNDIQLWLPSGEYYIEILDEFRNRIYTEEISL